MSKVDRWAKSLPAIYQEYWRELCDKGSISLDDFGTRYENTPIRAQASRHLAAMYTEKGGWAFMERSGSPHVYRLRDEPIRQRPADLVNRQRGASKDVMTALAEIRGDLLEIKRALKSAPEPEPEPVRSKHNFVWMKP